MLIVIQKQNSGKNLTAYTSEDGKIAYFDFKNYENMYK